jgi:hypothetical protein
MGRITAITHSEQNQRGSRLATGPAANVIEGMGVSSGDERTQGTVEYSTNDVMDVGEGEEPDKTHEVLVIQRAARRYLKRRNEDRSESNDMLTIGRDRLFRDCKKSAGDIHARYRKIYLGPVPHLLLCVEWIVTRAQSLKNIIKAQRRDATLTELSDLISQQQQMR